MAKDTNLELAEHMSRRLAYMRGDLKAIRSNGGYNAHYLCGLMMDQHRALERTVDCLAKQLKMDQQIAGEKDA